MPTLEKRELHELLLVDFGNGQGEELSYESGERLEVIR
jgi:hypothetical protein